MARKAQPKRTVEDRMIDAALGLAAEKPWARVGLDDVAKAAEVSLADAYDAFGCRAALVAGLIRRHDKQMLAGDDPSLEDESRRDRLFDVIMRRLEGMKPHRKALKSMAMGAPADAATIALSGPQLIGSVQWMLRAAGVPSDGALGAVRTAAVAAVYGQTLRAFMRDDSEDLATTMAALDKALKRAGRALGG